MKRIKLKYIMPFWGSSILFISLIIINKTVGYTHVANLYAKTPLTWSEIYVNLPKYVVFSFAFGLFTYLLFSQIENGKNK